MGTRGLKRAPTTDAYLPTYLPTYRQLPVYDYWDGVKPDERLLEVDVMRLPTRPRLLVRSAAPPAAAVVSAYAIYQYMA